MEVLKMPGVNQAQVEEEMRKLAEERTRSFAGDAPLLTRSQTAKIWNRSPGWVKSMQAAGRVPVVSFGNREKVQRAVVIWGLVRGV
jgi:hypothetical protein